MSKTTITLSCKQVAVEGNYSRGISVTLEGVEEVDLLKHLSPEQLVSVYDDTDSLLDAIGMEAAMNYFGLEKEEE